MGGPAECTARWVGGEWYCSKCIDKRIKVENSELILSYLFVCHVYGVNLCILIINKNIDMIFFRQIIRRRLKISA